jgi:hypothetical protein
MFRGIVCPTSFLNNPPYHQILSLICITYASFLDRCEKNYAFFALPGLALLFNRFKATKQNYVRVKPVA